MTQKKTVANSDKTPSKRKPVLASVKASPARRRTSRKTVNPSEAEIRQKAYDLWESRGRPVGSPEIDWFAAQDCFATAKAS